MKHSFSLVTLLCISFSVHAEQLAEFDENGEMNLGILAQKEGNVGKTLSFQEYFDRGTQALRKGEIDVAILNLEKSKKEKSFIPQTHFNLAIAYETKGRIDDAIEAYKDAILQRLDYPKAHLQLAKLLQQRGLIDQAIVHFEQAVHFDPQLVEPALTAARLLCNQEQFEKSLEHFEHFLQKRPNDFAVKFEYANTLNTTNHTEKALEIYYELLRQRPNESGILYNTAYTLKKLGRIKDAMPYYEAVLKRNPNHAEAHFSLGLAYLITGDFKQGWPEYEWRWQRNTQLTPRTFKQPQWDGTPLDGKTILLHAEQGLGDTFQFIRYAKVIKEQYNGKVIFASQRPLQTFISRCCPYIDTVTTLNAIPSTFDTHAPLMTLPCILKSDEQTIPHDIPYITPDPTLVEFWRRRLEKDTQFKVGICWQGNNNYSTPFLRAVVAAKSIAMKKFASLASVEGVTFYSLQRETGTDQLKGLPSDFKLVTFEEDFDKSRGRFMDTAAVIKNLDLVITVDTSIAHLSAAIGTPVWTILPTPPDWRWMLNRTDTPWYPNMRLFRQPEQGAWDSVMKQIVSELERTVAQKSMTTKNITLTHQRAKAIPDKTIAQSSKSIGPEIFSTATQLKKELALLTTKFKQVSQELSSLHVSTDNKEFVTKLRTLYLLSEMQNGITEKIAVLEGGK